MIGKTNALKKGGKPEQTKTVEFNPGSANSITITPDSGYVLSAVDVGKPATMIPENIKSGIDIGGVVGTFEGGVDTSDATATSNDILLGKTAYANKEKITGTIPTYNNEHENGYVQINTLKKLLDATKSTSYLFYNYKGTSVNDLISYDDTENVTNMNYMFQNCSNITSIPLLNTYNVTTMAYIFNGCTNLLSIPLLDTSKVIYLNRAFYGCKKISSIPLINTSGITSMNSLFRECINLTTIPLIDTSKVTDMQYMFHSCHKLTSIPLLNTSTVYDISYMFYSCSSLTEIPGLDVSKVNYMNATFSSCSKLTAIHMTGIKASFDISASTLFTSEALHEIIGNLATVTSTQTLTMGSTNLAKVSEEYVTIATNKGWTLA